MKYVLIGILGIIVIVVCVEVSTKFVLSKLKHNVVFEEFPPIDESALPKYTSFDSELGWERQPNEVRKKDTGHQNPDDPEAEKVVYSTDKYASRVCEIDRNSGEYNIATYGDSYCFCREVEDNETLQHYLSQDLGIHVSNYGVGNYGIGQSLLRMKRRFDDDPADYVVMTLSDKSAINRCLSAWKHYYEFGNTFAVKPRYTTRDGTLEVVPTPIEQKEEILELQSHSEHLRSNDYHYENWFKSHLLKRPYFTYWFQSRKNIPYAASGVLTFFTKRKFMPKRLHQWAASTKLNWERRKEKEVAIQEAKYRGHLRNEFTDLFIAILSEFTKYVKSRDSVPIFLPIRHPDYYKHEKVDPLNNDMIQQIEEQIPDLQVIDPREDIADNCKNPADLYVGDGFNGHPSPEHNRLNATFIKQAIKQYREEEQIGKQ